MRTFGLAECKVGLVAAVLCWMLGSSVAQSSPPIRPLPIPEARVNGPTDIAQGDLWMSWSVDHRLGFVQGLLEGSYWGYFNACTEAEIAAPSLPGLNEKCMAHIPAAHLTSEQYATMLNDFYSRHPEDRALPIRRLLLKLLEPGMNVDGVHKWLNELIESTRRSEAK